MSLAACASTTPEMAAGVQPHAPAARIATRTTPAQDGYAAPAPGAAGGRYKIGAPYQIGGMWYVPAEQPNYDEVGLASWYGDEFNGKPTANGERFDMYAASAAHATLPMPCIVEVTNLENGRTIRVRMNDRGPFHPGRIIDLSQGAARELGYYEKGTAKVRVRYVGPARLDGSLTPLFVANADTNANPAKTLQQIAAAPPPPAVAAAWRDTSTAALASAAPAPAAPRAVANAIAGGYAVQAGAFSDPAKAQRIAGELARAGQAAVRPLDMPDRKIYRVVVGPWRDQAEAQAARAQVAALGYADARVIKAF